MSSTIHTAVSNPGGAPPEACVSLKPRHEGIVEQEWIPGLITLTISNTSSPNSIITTYIPGAEYTGLWLCEILLECIQPLHCAYRPYKQG